MATSTAWAALVTRLPAADDLPLSLLIDLINASKEDVQARTGRDVAEIPTSPGCVHERPMTARTPVKLSRSDMTGCRGLRGVEGRAGANLIEAKSVYRHHAREVLTEINSNPFAYLRNHPPPKPQSTCSLAGNLRRKLRPSKGNSDASALSPERQRRLLKFVFLDWLPGSVGRQRRPGSATSGKT